MDKTPPRPMQVAFAVGFALSCFGLLLFLWVAFGGPIPLAAKGYRVTVPFSEAAGLATEADVRISGVTVGRVTSIELADGRYANATLELDSGISPLPASSRAVLRTKTLLGETYVELTPGAPGTGSIAEGGALPRARVAKSVQLDEILRTFDERTRADLGAWLRGAGSALGERAFDLNAAVGTLDPFTRSAREVLAALDYESDAVSGLIDDGGEVLAAISERPRALRSLISHANEVFSTTAERNAGLRRTFELLPAFLAESERTLASLEGFSELADPLVRRLTPAARELHPAVTALGDLAPELSSFSHGLASASDRAASGFGAVRELLGDPLPALLGGVDPWLDQVTPQLEALRAGRREVTALLGNLAAAANAFNRPPEADYEVAHYLRTVNPLNPEALAAYDHRPSSSRSNPYLAAGDWTQVASGLPSFATGGCGESPPVDLDPSTAGLLPSDLFARIRRFAFARELSTAHVPAPPCRTGGKRPSLGGPPSERTYYQHVNPLGD